GRDRLDLRRHARFRTRLPWRALRHRPDRGGSVGGAGAPWRPARRTARSGRQPTAATFGEHRRTVVFGAVPGEPTANGDGDAGLPLLSTKRIVQTLILIAILLVGIYFLFPKIAGFGDALGKLDDANPIWIAVAIGLNVLAYATYIALFKAVVGGDALKLSWTETYEIHMAGVAATPLL